MTKIDPTARVSPGAQLGKDVTVGPYTVIGPHVTVADGCEIHGHVNLTGHTTIGPRTKVYPFASLGTEPQSVHYKGEPSRLVVGSDCVVREHVTMNIGTGAGRDVTIVGDHCYFMTGAHVGHDCNVGNHVTFANNATLGGFCDIGDNVFLGGLCAVHQFSRVGEQVMIGGLVGVTSDVIPYAIVIGHRGSLAGLNRIGLRRRGVKPDTMRTIYRGYRSIFYGSGTFKERLASTAEQFHDVPHVMNMVAFIRASKRPVAAPRGRASEED